MRPDPVAGPILVSAHDAGGAEVVSSWILRHRHTEFRLVAEGPAQAIFLRKLPACNVLSRVELPQLVRTSRFLLTGTSWGSDLELQAIELANACKLRSASFIDHWVNYPQRFVRHGKAILPGEIWVGDEFALSTAQKYFPTEILRLEANPYFADIRDQLTALPQQDRQNGKLRILYVTEPISSHFALPEYSALHPKYDEYSALAYFWSRLATIKGTHVTVRIRTHPAEPGDKYVQAVEYKKKYALHFSENTSLLQDCAWADWVVGCESMAMVIGLIAGKQVFTAIPPEGRRCQLPQTAIQPLTATAIHHALSQPPAPPIC